jgi:hypothetical protein
MASALKYRTGEEVREGDKVLYHGNAAHVELVASDPANPEASWYLEEFGGGVLISDPLASGRTFIRTSELSEYEDLILVARASESQ